MSYDLTPLKAPRLAGMALRLFTVAAEMPLVGVPLRRVMLNAAGIPSFRDVPAEEAAVVVPPLPGVGDLEDGSTQQCEWALPAAPPNSSGLEDAASFTAAYRDGTATPEDVAERFLDAVAESERVSPPLRAFVFTDAADLRAQAREATRRRREGRTLGPLDGVPVAVKDELDQVPYRTTAGTRFLGSSPATREATVVARLRAAGALLVGKTNMQETGLGITGINPHHGTPRNPYDPSRITGGSSSGSAAAVAAGLCPLALGADAGGSIRIPAGLCGVIGLKPTFGRMSERGAVPICWSVAHVGAIGATARDVALAYLSMAGPDPEDPNTLRQPRPTPGAMAGERDLRGLTVGVYRPWFEDAEATVVAACRQAVDALASAGARVREIDIPEIHLVRPVHLVTVATEWMTAFERQYAADRKVFGYDVRLVARLARSLRPTDYVHAQRLRRRICSHFSDALRAVDVIATPTTAATATVISPAALRAGESDFVTLDRMTRFVTAANITGLPAISFPAGYDDRGLPIGLQLIGRPWQEDVLLHFAACAEPLVPRRPPRVRYRLLQRLAMQRTIGSRSPSSRGER
jgi:Asp-tRNA(Asn)/Glu-tRNA(Gln) amidotransferase A subunit family amidase